MTNRPLPGARPSQMAADACPGGSCGVRRLTGKQTVPGRSDLRGSSPVPAVCRAKCFPTCSYSGLPAVLRDGLCYSHFTDEESRA